MPDSEIAFIHDATNDEARAKLFARCRTGQVRILIGSTHKMGVGTNIHTRAVALTHLDCPWRPADIEQREGRIIRQGNQNTHVHVIRVATEASFDVFMWQTCERKQTFADQLMRGQVTGREADDIGDSALSYAEVKALATGNPLVIEQAGVQADIAKLERLEAAHRDDQWRLRRAAESARREAHDQRRLEATYAAAIRRRIDTSGDKFRIEIDGTTYTSRPDAGKVLLQRARDLIYEVAGRPGHSIETRLHTIGRLAGFPLTAHAFKLRDATEAELGVVLGDNSGLSLRLAPREIQASRPDRVITSLEGRIRRLDDDLAATQQRAAEAEQRAASAEERVGAPFPEQSRLDNLRRRHQQILDELAPDPEPSDVPTPNGTRSPEAEPAHTPTTSADNLGRLRQRLDRPHTPTPGGGISL